MPAKKHPTVWKAEPHTLAKIAILKSYLFAWFQVMGRTAINQPILFIDGFAGPGEYTNSSEGSPIAALTAAKAVLASSGAAWKAGIIHCAFIEQDTARFANLSERVSVFLDDPRLKIHLHRASFVAGLGNLQVDIPAPFGGKSPLFAFLDPFGATGVPFSTVATLLQSGKSEVLINLDADGIARNLLAGNDKLLDSILPDGSWRDLLRQQLSLSQLSRSILDLYKKGLSRLPNVKYVFAFEMQSANGMLNYYLVFASRHPLGLEKMKEAMRKIDQTGEYFFSDANVGQMRMFRSDDPQTYSQLLYRYFAGRRVPYATIHDYALNETPFPNPKAMLSILEKSGGFISKVESTDPKRRKGTFNAENIRYIEFTKGEERGEEDQN